MSTGAFPDLQTIARRLGGTVNGAQVLAPGPDHSAADRSLSVKLDSRAPDGFLVNSFAGDDPIVCRDYVREKLGLPAFKPNGKQAHTHDDIIAKAVMAAAMSQGRNDKGKGRIVATYDYTGADGTLAYQVLRFDPKDFRQRRPDGNGGWIWKLDERRVVYRWPDLAKFPDATVFVTEGEKDADRIAELELCATTVASGKWTDDCIKALVGRDIIILQDNDDAGRKKALEAATALHGVVNSIRVVALPDLPDKGDVSDWLDANHNNSEKFIGACFDAPLWMPGTGSAETGTEAKTETKAEQQDNTKPDERPPLPFLSLSTWDNQPMIDRDWTVKDRIPANNVTLLSGEGSVGKSILSLQLAVAVVLGRDWLGALPEPGHVIAVYCEDDADELHRRIDCVRRHYGVNYSDFANLHLLSLAGGETLMAKPDRNNVLKTTGLFDQLQQAACDLRPRLIVLDNSADIFAGNENDRAQVRQFIGLLRGLAIASGAGVLLTSHPSLTGISTGTGLSGSTAWNASVRSRLYFKRATTEKDEVPDPDLRVLEVMKSNYGPAGETINLRWKNGLFVPIDGVTNLEKLAAEQATEQLFLSLLDQFNQQGRSLCDKPNASNYAPTLFAKEKQARDRRIRKRAFEAAMRDLFAADKICLQPYGPPSRQTSKLACRK